MALHFFTISFYTYINVLFVFWLVFAYCESSHALSPVNQDLFYLLAVYGLLTLSVYMSPDCPRSWLKIRLLGVNLIFQVYIHINEFFFCKYWHFSLNINWHFFASVIKCGTFPCYSSFLSLLYNRFLHTESSIPRLVRIFFLANKMGHAFEKVILFTSCNFAAQVVWSVLGSRLSQLIVPFKPYIMTSYQLVYMGCCTISTP